MSDRLLFITTLTRLLEGRRHVFVGGGSAAAATASLLQRALSGDRLQITMLGDKRYLFLSNDYSEIFNCAATGRYDAFFMGGGQIDGGGNVNLIGIGDHPTLKVRWPGSRGTPLIYMMIENTILFLEEHTRRVLVPRVDYISAPGTSEPGVYHPGGPVALVTPRCVFSFDRKRARFTLETLNPGHSLEEVNEHTGFDFDVAPNLGETPGPGLPLLELLRDRVLDELSVIYPQYTETLRNEVDAAIAAQRQAA
ncbi:MAG TPA: CoA-transferase [Rhizobiaceae bacterium]|nr:CoA-transferase [Rhizobiaceae bacterium]